MWDIVFEILSAKVEFLTQFNVTKTGIEYIEQMTYAIGSLMMKSRVAFTRQRHFERDILAIC